MASSRPPLESVHVAVPTGDPEIRPVARWEEAWIDWDLKRDSLSSFQEGKRTKEKTLPYLELLKLERGKERHR